MKTKKLCKWKAREIGDHADELAKIVRKGKVVCMKCARAATSKKYLCNPCKLQDHK